MISNRQYGPTLELSNEIDEMKYRQTGEDFGAKCTRIAHALADNDQHFDAMRDILREMKFLPAGRVQNAMGAARQTTAYNCFVSQQINDDMESIMSAATSAAQTMRKGGGIGYDFSHIRPRGDLIKSLDSKASGPVSFMGIFDAICQTISSSGARRGAQMGVLRIDHPDIMEFINAKHNSDKLTGFNISVGVTDKFMECLDEKKPFDLKFEGKVYDSVDPVGLWDAIMRGTWDWAEPGVLFIDTINAENNLYYCEEIAATNPCGEQPLPPYGACLLGSFNLTQYVGMLDGCGQFNWIEFEEDITHVVRAMDNVIDRTIYPLPHQEDEAKNKRRMGLGITGLANAGSMMNLEYGTASFLLFTRQVLEILRNAAYSTSADLAEEKGSFPMYRSKDYLKSSFIKELPEWLQEKIRAFGIRNSHLTSIAPTGTISLVADNISSGIEPPFSNEYTRTLTTFEGTRTELVQDYAYARGFKGKTANEITAEKHLEVLCVASQFVDSAVSKTCNVGDSVTYEQFKDLYLDAWRNGCKGITTFRASGKRYGILNEVPMVKTDEEEEKEEKEEEEIATGGGGGEACYIDPLTGQKSCE